jgi:hypothetical protein
MKRSGLAAMKAFLALSWLVKREGRIDWVRIVTISSTIITVGLIALYVVEHRN